LNSGGNNNDWLWLELVTSRPEAWHPADYDPPWMWNTSRNSADTGLESGFDA